MNPAPVVPSLVRPRRLSFGDTVAIVAPASAPPDPAAIDRSVAALERLGFQPKLGAHVRDRHGFLAGDDAVRAGDLMEAFLDPSVNAIICLRGGYGTARILPRLDYAAIRRNAKVLVGYSDITTLLCALLGQAGLVSFHGPMLNSEISADAPVFTLESLLRTIMQPTAAGGIARGHEGPKPTTIRGGRASGPLLGGNLSVLCTVLGTPYQPDFRGQLLFLEDVGEKPYRMDRMLTHLANAGVFEQVVGVAIGVNKDCDDPKAAEAKEYRQTLADVFQERLGGLSMPVVTGLPFGHVPFNATLPLGIRATLDAEVGDLIIEEPAVL